MNWNEIKNALCKETPPSVSDRSRRPRICENEYLNGLKNTWMNTGRISAFLLFITVCKFILIFFGVACFLLSFILCLSYINNYTMKNNYSLSLSLSLLIAELRYSEVCGRCFGQTRLFRSKN